MHHISHIGHEGLKVFKDPCVPESVSTFENLRAGAVNLRV